VSEDDIRISSTWQPTDFTAPPAVAGLPGGPGNQRRPGSTKPLSRLPIVVFAIAYAYEFVLAQFPEFGSVTALAQLGTHASVLMWGSLPGIGGAGASGAIGVLVLLAIAGAIALPITCERAELRLVSIGAAALVAIGTIARVIEVYSQSWSPTPTGGLLFGILIAVAAVLVAAQILLTGPGQLVSTSFQPQRSRLTGIFILILISWIGVVAIGRSFEPTLITAVQHAPAATRWHYLGDKSSWWMYALGAPVVVTGYAAVQLLPPWSGRGRQLVTAVIWIIVGLVAFQLIRSPADTAAAHVAQFGPSSH
jgi:hypothetical protein